MEKYDTHDNRKIHFPLQGAYLHMRWPLASDRDLEISDITSSEANTNIYNSDN